MDLIKRLIDDNNSDELYQKIEENMNRCILTYKEIIKDKKDPFNSLYDIYNEYLLQEIDSSLENEIKTYQETDLFVDKKPNIQTNIMKQIHIEALRRLIEILKNKNSNIIQKKLMNIQKIFSIIQIKKINI